jgi:hypothetical protein
MAITSVFRGRKPPPRHALEPATTPTRPPRRSDGTTLGIIVVLVLSSAFVAGTTATFTSTATNSSNEFAAAALATPGLPFTAEPKGNDVQLNWTNATGSDSTGAGYRLSVTDWQAAPNSVPTTCGASNPTYTKIGNAQSGVSGQGFLDTGASGRANFADGRLVCYQVQTAYPCCSGGVEGANAWLSQNSGSQANPITVANLGMTLVSFTSGNGNTSGGLRATDWFEFTFNQPISNPVTNAQTVCADGTDEEILIGLDGSGNNCPQTSGSPSSRDSTLAGFRLVRTSASGGVSTNARYAISSVTFPACPGGSPEGCYKMRITLGSLIAGTNPTLSGTYKVEPSADPNYLVSTTGNVKLCGTSTTTGAILDSGGGATSMTVYTGDPTNGKCIYTGHNFLGKI